MLRLISICSAVQFVIDFSFLLMHTCITVGITGVQCSGWRGNCLEQPSEQQPGTTKSDGNGEFIDAERGKPPHSHYYMPD